GSGPWDDNVKGGVEFSNDELDDLVIARPDGTPTYNFCVVVDDIDMKITHVIRGDDHVNNTPRQIHIFHALGHEPPVYAHLPTVLNEQGEKMSKRHGAKPVTQYRDDGYLADAVVNYLARLGWSHGGALPLARAIGLFKDRCATTVELAEWLGMYFVAPTPSAEDLSTHVGDAVKPALIALRDKLAEVAWDKASIAAAIKATLGEHGLKMPQLALPLRVLVCGRAQTPSIEAVLELSSREAVLARLRGV